MGSVFEGNETFNDKSNRGLIRVSSTRWQYKNNNIFTNPWETILDETLQAASPPSDPNKLLKGCNLGNCAVGFTVRGKQPPYFVCRPDLPTSLGTNYKADSDEFYHCYNMAPLCDIFALETHCMCGFQDRILVSVYNTIIYSEQYNNAVDYTAWMTFEEYLNINHGGEITGLYRLNSTLFILTTTGIFAIAGENSELVSENVQSVISDTGSSMHCNCCGGGKIFFANYNGIFLLQERRALELSEPIKHWWRGKFNPAGCQMTFWDREKWLVVSPNVCSDGDTDYDTAIYDLKTQRWYKHNHFKINAITSSVCGEKWLIIDKYGGTNTYNIDWTAVGSGSPEQIVQTRFTDLGYPHLRKFLKRIHYNGTGVDKMRVYLRNTPHSAGVEIVSGEAGGGWANPSEWTVFNMQEFKEISIKFSGSGSMVLSKVGVEFGHRRI